MPPLHSIEELHTLRVLQDVIRRWWRVELAFAGPESSLFSELSKELEGELAPAERRVGWRVACPVDLEGERLGFLVAKNDGETGDFDGGGAPPRPPEAGKLRDLLEAGVAEVKRHQIEWIRCGRAPQNESHAERVGDHGRFAHLIGRSPAIQQVFRVLERVIRSESTVLIQGESGTGKELVARAIHDLGPRAKRAFVVQNCSAFNDNLLESALFGHVRGSFTGAIFDKKGLFEIADGGTFFLDEVGDMSAALQVKLLRVLQEGTFTPVGSTDTRKVDVRVIAATHKDLQKMMARGEFREDLYYRIHVIKVQLPPLRDRLEDLPLLVDHFIQKHFRPWNPNSTRPPRLSDAALAVMRRYDWPGNIRELENEIERCMVLGDGLEEVPESLLSERLLEVTRVTPPDSPCAGDQVKSFKVAMEQLEREMIQAGLIRTRGNKSRLAQELGISRSNLIMKIERYGIVLPPK
jgi:two-component system response regulator HupR/HoxA